MRRSRAAVAVAVVLLAGCSGLQVGPGSPATETLTPAPVEATGSGTAGGVRSPTPTPEVPYPPGLWPNGSIDREALAGAHSAVLENASYTVVVRGAVRNDSGVVERFDTTLRVENRSRYAIRNRGAARTEWTYVNGRAEYERVRETETGETRVSVAGPQTARDFEPPRLYPLLLYWYMPGYATRLTPVERAGQPFYRLYFRHFPQDGAWTKHADDFRMTAYVRADGLVRTLQFGYDRRRLQEEQTVRYRVAYRDIGATTVPEPDWVARYRANHSTVGSGATATGTDAGTATPAPPSTGSATTGNETTADG